MRNRKQLVLAASLVALLGATAWAQVPAGNAAYNDTTRSRSHVAAPRDSMSNDSATGRRDVTASDQNNDKGDVGVTTVIRREIMAKKGMSVNAQNVKIVTLGGKVTLRGVVNSESEKKTIGEIANRAAGSGNVTNDLQIK